MKTLVFDIETVPDVAAGRQIYSLPDLADEDVVRAMTHLHAQKTGSEFLPPHLHRIIAIAAVFHDDDRLAVCSLGKKDASEFELVRLFFDAIDKHAPQLVSWNGSGFDLPVLHYRALLHGATSSRYWDRGEHDSNFRYNNYLSRYHTRHIDLMDVLAGYQARAFAPLDQIARMLGFPGKTGLCAAQVEQQWREGRIAAIRDYCEIDALNTYLIFLKFELMQEKISKSVYQQNCEQLRDHLTAENKSHYVEFLNGWDKAGGTAAGPGPEDHPDSAAVCGPAPISGSTVVGFTGGTMKSNGCSGA